MVSEGYTNNQGHITVDNMNVIVNDETELEFLIGYVESSVNAFEDMIAESIADKLNERLKEFNK